MMLQAFDTLDEIIDDVGNARIEADSNVKDWQAEIKVGDYFLTIFEDFFIVNHVIASVIIDENDFVDPLDCKDVIEKMKNYRFCNCYSIACPDGEMGDVHVGSGIIKLCDSCGKDLTSYYQGNLKPSADSIFPELFIMCEKCGIALLSSGNV